MTAFLRRYGAVLARLLALLVVIAISVYIFSIRDQASSLVRYCDQASGLARYCYAGIFGLAFLSYATVLLPAPGLAIVFTMGGVLNPIGVALAAGAGAALGEFSGYLVGYSSQAVTERYQTYQQLVGWMKNNGPLAVFILSAIPNPFFDIAGAAAGSLKMPYPIFLFWCWLGQTVKMFAFAILGSKILNLLP